MTLDHFNNMSEDEKSAYLQSCESLETTIKDNDAELKSLHTENDNYKEECAKLEKELAETKQMNFTLARKVDASSDHPTFEDTLHNIYCNKEGR